jgi:hypothetical protein
MMRLVALLALAIAADALKAKSGTKVDLGFREDSDKDLVGRPKVKFIEPEDSKPEETNQQTEPEDPQSENEDPTPEEDFPLKKPDDVPHIDNPIVDPDPSQVSPEDRKNWPFNITNHTKNNTPATEDP